MDEANMAYDKPALLRQVFGTLGIMCSLFLVMGAAFAVVGVVSWRSAQEFQARGVNVAGRIEKLWESAHECRDSNSNVRRSCPDFNVGYSYEVDGQIWHHSGTAAYDQWAGLEVGRQILVRYLPEDPGNSVSSYLRDSVDEAGGLDVLGLVFGGLGGALVLGGGAGLVALILRAAGGARLRESGTARGAVVLAQEETNVSVNRRALWRIRWKDDTGALGMSRGRAREDLPQAGSRITIYADPSGRRKPVWEGDVGTRQGG